MATFSYTVLSSLPPAPASSSDPVLTPRDDLSVCVPRFKVKQDFLDLFDRILPFEYIEPLKSPGPGYEIYEGIATMFERVSYAVGRAECQLYISLAHGAYKSRGEVEFYRQNSINGAFTIRTGSVVRTTNGQREYVLLNDVVFGATDLMKIAEVEAKQADFQFDVLGIVTDINGNFLEGEIDDFNLPILDPPFAEPTIQVRQTTVVDRGQPESLDLHGKDRSIVRSVGETDDEYRYRVRSLPDTMSPAALVRQLADIFRPFGVTFDFIETWENDYQGCWDAPDAGIPNTVWGAFDPTLFVYDDPRADPPFHNRWMGPDDHIGGIIVVVPNVAAFEDFSYAYDDPAVTAADHETAFGRRAHAAFDIPDTIDSLLVLQAAYDGGDLARNAFYLQIYNLLQKIKPGGVFATLELEGQ